MEDFNCNFAQNTGVIDAMFKKELINSTYT